MRSLAMTVSLPQYLSLVTWARGLLSVLLRFIGVAEVCQNDLAIMITEALANAVRHGDAGGTIDLTVTIDEDACVIDVGNRGRRPDRANLPTAPPDHGQLSGRGLPLIAALSDTAEFIPAPAGSCSA